MAFLKKKDWLTLVHIDFVHTVVLECIAQLLLLHIGHHKIHIGLFQNRNTLKDCSTDCIGNFQRYIEL
jgi:hypothetical protein